jgi:hypothetical protein
MQQINGVVSVALVATHFVAIRSPCARYRQIVITVQHQMGRDSRYISSSPLFCDSNSALFLLLSITSSIHKIPDPKCGNCCA